MKNLIVLLLFVVSSLFAQQIKIKGIVTDSETGKSLYLANITVNGTNTGTVTDESGKFQISINNSAQSLIISYVGYKSKQIKIKNIKFNVILLVQLTRSILSSQTILIEAGIGEKGITPLTFSKIKRKEIENTYVTQDIPEFLSNLPSTTFYSEGGSGIGYNYLSIRGFDQRRISVSINGIPQNDPEDHNVYWVDFPDLLGSTGLIQVQRGAGSGVAGYPAIGGSINIITSPFSNEKKFNFRASLGSYNTRKYSVSLASGLIDKKYSIYVNLSNTLTSGYRNKSWVNFKSYHLSAVRYDKNVTSQINIYGGPIADGLVYTGLAKFAVKDKNLRRANYSDWGSDGNSYTYTVERRPEEIENFSQPHFELLNEIQLSKNVKFNSALFLVLGNGFFDYDGSWSVYFDDYFRLKANGFDSTATAGNALIRAQVENKQWGWIPRISIEHKNGRLILGGEYRNHRSVHWGSINFAQGLPKGVTKDYKYYYFQGGKDIADLFANENYNFTESFSVLAEVQLAYHKYKLYNEKYVGNNFTVGNVFVNPRIGLNYKFSTKMNGYISAARVSREPRLKTYYDAAESSAGEVPQFKLNADGNYDFSKPLVLPETMNSLDIGLNSEGNNFTASTDFFYMLFDNEIVKKGQVDRFGQPITGNIDRSVHTGLESSLALKFTKCFKLIANGSYSKNYISNGRTFKNFNGKSVALDLSGNRISGFPNETANVILQYNRSGLFAEFVAKYVGDFYSDNFDRKLSEYENKYPGIIGYKDNKVDAYFVANFMASYQFSVKPIFNNLKIFIKVNNLFDNLYAQYAIGKEFFPAAERNFVAGISLKM